MNNKEFIKQLNDVQELMLQEKYKEAIILLESLKEIEKQGDFDYNLTHRLYQLDSNSHSLYNQQVILKVILTISQKTDSITFAELNNLIKDQEDLNIDVSILRREIEILVLRSLLSCKIEENKISF